jgi:hypothetical protein
MIQSHVSCRWTTPQKPQKNLKLKIGNFKLTPLLPIRFFQLKIFSRNLQLEVSKNQTSYILIFQRTVVKGEPMGKDLTPDTMIQSHVSCRWTTPQDRKRIENLKLKIGDFKFALPHPS